jgi:hypothetical protein
VTIADVRPTYRLCASGQHEMTPENTKPHNGRRYCRACDTSARHQREERARTRMRQLLTGFAYWPRPGWHDRAVCRDAAPLLFQCGEKSDETENKSADMVSRERHAEARDYCEVCPVVAQCLGQALMLRDSGTRGGELLTPTDWKLAAPIVKELGL